MPDASCYITSEHEGLLEMCFNLGDRIEKGELVARIYASNRTGVAPVEYRAATCGLLAQRHFPGLIGCGDALAVIAIAE
jgi:N-alpha-acetyl-L-2,4-diaminobutyrate deacetylase